MIEVLEVNGVELLQEAVVSQEVLEVGVQGPPGPPGEGLQIRGGLSDVSELPDDAEIGWAFVIDGEAYVWDGLAWENIGPVLGPQGAQGIQGIQGEIGPVGPQGEVGPVGPVGPEGASAYEVALANGFSGTEAEWLDSLVGAAGSDGSDGASGASAYDIAVADGFVGTQSEWLASLAGPSGEDGADGADGASAYQVALANGFVGSETEWLASLVGPSGADGVDGSNGAPGAAGADGADGASAYDLAVANGFSGNEAAWLASLVGATGATGPAGADGADGQDGRTILYGTSAPTTEGEDGDFYIRTTTNFLYGPKAGGMWPAGVSLVGPAGDTGPAGADGADGADGTGIHVSDTPPVDPEVDDLWVDTSDAGAIGDVEGPGASAVGALAVFDDTTGKVIAALGQGTAGQVLTSQGAGAEPSWESLAGGGGGRELLTANRTYYVRTDGSNSNDGLANTSGGAFLTIQKAVDVVSGMVDTGGYNVTIQVADGTYAEAVVLKQFVGGGKVLIQGNTTTPGNVQIIPASASPCMLNGAPGCEWAIAGLRLLTSNWALYVKRGAYVEFSAIEFGGTQLHIRCAGMCIATGNHTIYSSSSSYVYVELGGYFYADTVTIAVTNSINFSGAFCSVQSAGYAHMVSLTFTGGSGVTGSRFSVTTNGILVSGGGSGSFPGNAAGTTSLGGQAL